MVHGEALAPRRAPADRTAATLSRQELLIVSGLEAVPALSGAFTRGARGGALGSGLARARDCHDLTISGGTQWAQAWTPTRLVLTYRSVRPQSSHGLPWNVLSRRLRLCVTDQSVPQPGVPEPSLKVTRCTLKRKLRELRVPRRPHRARFADRGDSQVTALMALRVFSDQLVTRGAQARQEHGV